MKKIISTYKINSHTQALLPAKSINYQTIVIEEGKKIYVRQTPLEIIRQGCADDWSDYDSRRNAVMQHTNFIQRLPIPVNIRKAFYFFPTHSPKHSNNCWIEIGRASCRERVKMSAAAIAVKKMRRSKLT